MPDWVKILKDYVDTLETIVGTEGGVALANKLTAARALLLDQITALRLAELDAGNIPTDLTNIIAYVDLIDDVTNGLAAIKAEVEGLAGAAMRGTDGAALAASWTAGLATILGNFTAARIGYLDNINNAQLLNITAARLGYIDLLADAINGLAAIKAEVEGLAGAAMRGTDNAALAATALSTAQWTNALATALGSYTAALATALGNYTAARAGYLDNINQAGLLQVTAARAALLDQITAARLGELDAANIPTDTDPKVIGRTQIFEKSITSAAFAGNVLVATITTQPCQIESVIIHANAAQTANMTSCGVFGGVGKVITFISAADATQANLNAADKQVAWTGAVRLAATKTIVISLVGTGAAAVDLTIVIKYRASVSGGYLV